MYEITVLIHKADDMGTRRANLLAELNRSGDINARSTTAEDLQKVISALSH